MRTLPVSRARSQLFSLLQEVTEAHSPVQITGKNGNAILVSEEDWGAIQETLYLLSIPGMRDSLLESDAEPLAECDGELDW